MESARLSDLIRSLKSNNRQPINEQEIRIRYALERFLARLAQSEYSDKFILKGGFLMGTIYSIGQRSTKDLDALVRNLKAEKLETVLDKGIMNSRMKDFYDLILLLSDPNRPEISLCYEAFRNTWNFRHQIEIDEELFEDWQFVIEDIENNDAINQIYWPNYIKDRRYAQGVEFKQIVHQVKEYILELNRYYLDEI